MKRHALVRVPGGRYQLGADDFYPEERPRRVAALQSFWISMTPVSNAQFARFVDDTGYVTTCEMGAVPVSGVFAMTEGPVDLRQPSAWWRHVRGASWRAPTGPGSSVQGLQDHPVVHISYEDALAYVTWAGLRLPSAEEWEAAAHGAFDGEAYSWGQELLPNGQLMANIWTGSFPWYFDRSGVPGTTPIGLYPSNRLGLQDMIGNVWEWTSTVSHRPASSCCANDAAMLGHVLKGGSFLCAAEYCARYRPAAWIAVTSDTTTQHIGFRCAADDDGAQE